MLLRRHTPWWRFAAMLCWVGAAWAQAPQTPHPPDCPPQPPALGRVLLAQSPAQDRGFLWRLSRGGRDSYLYATLHAGRPEWLALGPQLLRALRQSGVLALEINPTDAAVRAEVVALAQRPGHPLPPPLQQALLAAWQAECLDPAELRSGPPEWHALRLAVSQAQRLGLFAEFGAEVALLLSHLRSERPVLGLETVALQTDALLAKTPAEAERMVAELLDEHQAPQSMAMLRRLVAVWSGSDWDSMQRYAEWCACLDSAEQRAFFARMVTRRNAPMADAIAEHHTQQSVLAAVGALHMLGDSGLPALLRARGFVVSRVF